jgi:hypothetical protein
LIPWNWPQQPRDKRSPEELVCLEHVQEELLGLGRQLGKNLREQW